MYLHTLRIENFRGIRKTVIRLDDGTALIGENDCGISSVLDALELVLGHEEKNREIPDYLFHRRDGGETAKDPIRIQLRFAEKRNGDWSGEAFEAFAPLLSSDFRKRRELWYETTISPRSETAPPRIQHRLRSPQVKGKSSDPKLVGRLRRMNPVVRLTAGMLTGRGGAPAGPAAEGDAPYKISPDIKELADRINRAVNARLSGRSLTLQTDLDDGYKAAFSLLEKGQIKLGKWETGLTRSIGEIIGWHPEKGPAGKTMLHDPDSPQIRLGILLLIAALLRARPGGLAPDADPLWVIEEPEAHLHPITLTTVAIFIGLIQRQKIITTYSSELLATAPLRQVRRLVRHDGRLIERRVRKNVLSRGDLRRFHYHVRNRFGIASFARLWLMVEGESEFWILPQLARLMGYDFALEGIACVEFAQCGLEPPLKVARELGIEWHLIADGDEAGQAYIQLARNYLGNDPQEERLTLLPDSDIERFFWNYGYADVFRRAAKLPRRELDSISPARVIRAAERKHSKPFLALSVVEAIAGKDSRGIPPLLEDMVESIVDLARNSPERLAAAR